jgi:hypothetical protein
MLIKAGCLHKRTGKRFFSFAEDDANGLWIGTEIV